MNPEQVVVLTGPIGSGKSHVIEEFRQHGWQTIDADAVGHQVLAEVDVVAAIRKRWPAAISGSTVNRAQLASLVFADADQLNELESLTHPRIRHHISAWIADTPGHKVIEVSVPAAIAQEWGPKIVVDASRAVRHGRLIGRGMSEEDLMSRMNSQPARPEWLALADIVISNELEAGIAARRLIDDLEST